MPYTTVIDDEDDNLAAYHNELVAGLEDLENSAYNWNYLLSPSVSSNNLSVSIKRFDGSNASAASPIRIRIGNAVREITGALSVTKNAGTNWFNSGGSELATFEVDYFVYLGYNATDGVVIGFSRLPGANVYSDFSATTTNERYAAISTITSAASGDNYINIGRFTATLSAGAGYTWSVPTFTSINLVQRPTFTTRYLNYQPVYSASGSMTYTSVTTTIARYRINNSSCDAWIRASGTTGGTASTTIAATLPMNGTQAASTPTGCGFVADSGNVAGVVSYSSSTSPHRIAAAKYDSSNFALAAGKIMDVQMMYEI